MSITTRSIPVFFKRFLIGLFLIVALAAALMGCKDAPPKLKIGDPMPQVTLESFKGGTVTLPGERLKGKVAVIMFWAEGCRFCEEDMPYMQELYTKYAGRGLEFVALQVGGSREASANMAGMHSLTFPMLYDAESSTVMTFGVMGVPTIIFIDREGIVKEKVLGGLDAKAMEKILLLYL